MRARKGTNKRPLVTFALFAYNQQAYIREAVERAFNQTYEPLEIILSDDCSTDRTYEIMKELATNYNGPHHLVVRRNDHNLGTAQHVHSVFSLSHGALFVVAAGDDLSREDRVSVVQSTWDQAGRPSGVVHSGWETYRDSDGTIINTNAAKKTPYHNNPLLGFTRGAWLPAAAPTCAFTRDVFERFPPLLGGSIIEDAPLFLRAALIGTFVATDEPLVRVRKHSSNTGSGHNLHDPHRWNRFIRSKLIAFENMQNDLHFAKTQSNIKTICAIEDQILQVARSTSPLLLPLNRKLNLSEKFSFARRMTTSKSVASTWRTRLEYALTFFGFRRHETIKLAIKRFIRHEP